MEQLIKDNILTFEPFIDPNAPPPPPPPPPLTTTASATATSTSTSTSNPVIADDSSSNSAVSSENKVVSEKKEGERVGEVDVGNDEKNNSDVPNTIAVSTLMTDMKSNQTQSMEQELEILSYEEFCDALSCLDVDSKSDPRSNASMWCVSEDETLSLLVNSLSDKLGLDPLMVSSSLLEGHRVSRGLLPHRTANQIQARYAALCVLNKVFILFFSSLNTLLKLSLHFHHDNFQFFIFFSILYFHYHFYFLFSGCYDGYFSD